MHNQDFLTLVEEYRPLVKEVTVQEVKQKLTSGNGHALIDVREGYEWRQGHLPQAIHLARGILERDIEATLPNKNTPIILYCGGGFRSILAAYNLQKMGYTQVYSMDGGIRDWINQGYELTF